MANVKYVFVFIIFGAVCSSNISKDFLQSLKSCDVGDVSQNECTKCICSPKSVYVCKPLNCTNKLKEKPKVSNIVNAQQSQKKLQSCHPHMVYVQDSVTCICDEKGFWPHENCDETFKTLSPSNITQRKCKPNSYVIIECNVCRCSPYGNINKDRCTTNVCENQEGIGGRRHDKSSHVYGSCESGNWYSLAPCQFCFCVNKNRLLCNTGHQNKPQLELGSYSLSVCGKQIIKEAIELVPDPIERTALRKGKIIYNETITSTVPALTTENYIQAQTTSDVTTEIINVDNDDNKIQNEDNNKNEEAEYYSDSDDVDENQETTKSKIAPRNGAITHMPFQEVAINVDNDNDYDKKEESTDEEDDSDNEIAVEFVQRGSTGKDVVTTPSQVTTITKIVTLPTERIKPLKKTPLLDPLKTLSRTLRISLPMVIDKVFKLALRKSMVSLVPDSNCVPGTSSYIKCNMCFCMKNNKLLCTNNPCK